MRDQVDEVKSKADIVSVISERIQLKKAGKNFKALCPFHSERTPSFIVSPDIQFFKCFGCGEHGDVFAFLQKYEGMDFYEALKYLADRVGIKLKFSKENVGIKSRLYEINNQIANFYHYVLLFHPLGRGALEYLTKKRKLEISTIKAFKLGYSPPDSRFLSRYFIGKKRVDPGDLEKTGVIVRKTGQIIDRFRGRLIFPLYDHRGNVCGFSGRLIEEVRDLPKYVNTPETPIYIKSRLLYGLNLVRVDIKKHDYAVVVEGPMDMISSWQSGVKNTVAISGAALTLDQVKLLSRYTKRIIFALDSDFAGNLAAKRGIEIAEKEGMEMKVAVLGEFKDPDEAVRNDPEAYKSALKAAVAIWDFLIDRTFSKHKKLGGIEKARISKELTPILRSISDKIVQAHYVELVSKRLAVQTDAVWKQIEGGNVSSSTTEVAIETKDVKNRREILQERLMALLLVYNPKLIIEPPYKLYFKSQFSQKIIASLQSYLPSNSDFVMADFVKTLPEELKEKFSDLMLDSHVFEISDNSVLEKEVAIVAREIEIFDVKEEMKNVSRLISESYTDKVKLEDLNRKFSELAQRLSELEENNHKGIILLS